MLLHQVILVAISAVKRFESQPVGRRAVLVVSDGIDTSHGLDYAAPATNPGWSVAENRSSGACLASTRNSGAAVEGAGPGEASG